MKRIEITAEKIMDKGEPKWKIIAVTAPGQDDLPTEYLDGIPRCYADNLSGIWLYVPSGHCWLRPGWIIPVKLFNEYLKTIKVCGERLAEINKKIRETAKAWQGTETFII